MAAARRWELDLRAFTGPALIEGDPITLREAFTNLLDNARNYAGDQYPVQIRILPSADGNELLVEFADRGPGIPDAEKDRVLERFVRGSAGQQSPGSGFAGLAIVKAVADAHRGRLACSIAPVVGWSYGWRCRPSWPWPEAGWRPSVLLAALLAPAAGRAGEITDFPAPAAERGRLLIHAATDRPLMAPLLRATSRRRTPRSPSPMSISTPWRSTPDVVAPAGGPVPDLAISSAMDLQAKLVNDGWTQPHVSPETLRVPDWANWRNEVYGFTLEPAVIAYAMDGLAQAEVPRSRPELLRLLQSQPDRFRRRVATYDVAESGVGYLFATQDFVLSSQFWRLTMALGDAQVRLEPTTGAILDAIERGEVLIGYNVLGSYVRARQEAGAPIGIVQPRDYTLLMSRVVAIPRAASHPVLAKLLVDYLLSDRGQQVIADTPGLQPLLLPGAASSMALGEAAVGPVQPIVLGPALLAFLDRLKREHFLADWSASVRQP